MPHQRAWPSPVNDRSSPLSHRRSRCHGDNGCVPTVRPTRLHHLLSKFSAMKLKHVYLLLCVLGTLWPYEQFFQFVGDNGLDFRLFHDELFGSHASAFFAVDVVVSSIVLWVFVFAEGRRLKMRNLWAPVVANLLVGVSLGLPLFLYMREGALER
jgi:uncharacterized protein DUF2834